MIGALAAEDRFSGICHRSGLDPRTAARTLHFLQLAGQVCLEQSAPANDHGTPPAQEDAVREAIAVYVKLIGELAAPLVALDGPEAVATRLNRIFEEGAAKGHTLLQGIYFSDQGALNPEPVEQKALRLVGDRVRQTDEALGEIVAYLEFELRNHPGIEDCSPFLEAVGPLRAMLVR